MGGHVQAYGDKQADDLYDLNGIIDMCSKSDDESIRSYVMALVNKETYMRLVAGIEAKWFARLSVSILK